MKSKLRRCARLLAANLLHYTGLLRLWSRLRRIVLHKEEVCVLGIHRVMTEEDWNRSDSLDSVMLKETTFVKVLEYLDRHFCVVSLDAILPSAGAQAQGSKPMCLLTFDDGWRDNYTTAYPALKKFKMPATIFLTTGLIGSTRTFWVEEVKRAWIDPLHRQHIQSEMGSTWNDTHRASSLEGIIEFLKHLPAEERRSMLEHLRVSEENVASGNDVDTMMTWSQVSEMSRNGIEFGSHTVTHPLLSLEAETTVERELHVAGKTLEEKLGRKVRGFAYPNGDWNERVRRQVQLAGYECAFSVQPGWHSRGSDLYSVRRILLHERKVTGWDGRFSAAMLSLALAIRSRGGAA